MNALTVVIIGQSVLLLIVTLTSPRAMNFIAMAGAAILVIIAAPILAPWYLIDRIQRRSASQREIAPEQVDNPLCNAVKLA